jgi:regulatory protein
VVSEDRPAPAWAGDVHAGVEAWTRSTEPGPERPDARPNGARGGRSRSGTGSRSGPPPPDKVAQGPDADPEAVARKILLDALTGQARSRKELADKLAKKEVPGELAERLLDRFEEVGLVDDEAFARAWIESRQPGKGLARRALAQELRRKGIDDETAREALDEIDPEDEEAAARALVRKKLRSVQGVDHQKATRRLVGMLARKGYGAGMAFAIVRDELGRAGEADPELGLDADSDPGL